MTGCDAMCATRTRLCWLVRPKALRVRASRQEDGMKRISTRRKAGKAGPTRKEGRALIVRLAGQNRLTRHGCGGRQTKGFQDGYAGAGLRMRGEPDGAKKRFRGGAGISLPRQLRRAFYHCGRSAPRNTDATLLSVRMLGLGTRPAPNFESHE